MLLWSVPLMSVGRLLDKLETLEIAENTIIFFYLTTEGLSLKMDQTMGR